MGDALGSQAILAPVVALIAWTLVMLIWMNVARGPAMKNADPATLSKRGMRGSDLEGVLPDSANWAAHNYNHLMEQPTLFYAVSLTLALLGAGGGVALILAWAYVGLRVVHSLIQATGGKVGLRFLMFLFSSLCLIGLTVLALLDLFAAA